MLQETVFVRNGVLPSWWANAIQKRLSVGHDGFAITKKNATTLQVVAGPDMAAVGIDIAGKWRWNEATTERAGGGPAGVYDVFVTSTQNVIDSNPQPGTDHTVRSFKLAIVTEGQQPTPTQGEIEIWRLVYKANWDGGAFTSLVPLINAVPEDGVRNAQVAANAGILPSKIQGTAVVTSDGRLSDKRVPVPGSVTNAEVATNAGILPTKIQGTAVVEGDSRLQDARVPTGNAGGGLGGAYPSPTVVRAAGNFTIGGDLLMPFDSGGTVLAPGIVRPGGHAKAARVYPPSALNRATEFCSALSTGRFRFLVMAPSGHVDVYECALTGSNTSGWQRLVPSEIQGASALPVTIDLLTSAGVTTFRMRATVDGLTGSPYIVAVEGTQSFSFIVFATESLVAAPTALYAGLICRRPMSKGLTYTNNGQTASYPFVMERASVAPSSPDIESFFTLVPYSNIANAAIELKQGTWNIAAAMNVYAPGGNSIITSLIVVPAGGNEAPESSQVATGAVTTGTYAIRHNATIIVPRNSTTQVILLLTATSAGTVTIDNQGGARTKTTVITRMGD